MAASQPSQQSGTRARVLAAVRDLGHATVADLAARTSLSRPTVETSLADLESAGVVETLASPQQPGGAGRPAKVSRYLAEHGVVAGVDLTGQDVRIIVSDLAGTPIALAAPGTRSPQAGSADLTPVTRLLDETLRSVGFRRGDLRAVGVGVAGLVRDGVLETAPEVSAWRGRDVQALLAEALRVPTVVDNDLTLAASAEAQADAFAGVDVGVYALAWHHVSARVVIGGRVLRGRHNRAGEVGLLSSLSHVRTPTGTLREALPPVVAALQRLRSNAEDTDGLAVLADLTDAMAPAIAALSLATDPDRIVLGGDLSEFHDLLAPRLSEAIERTISLDSTAIEVVPGALGVHAVALGALQAAFSRFPKEIYGADDVTAPTIPSVDPLLESRSQPAPFNAALVGVGARAGLAGNLASAGGRVVAAVDPDQGRRHAVDELFGADVPLLPDTTTLLRDFPDLDGAIVASPDDTHAAIAIQLLEAGVPVYLEKPLAITTEDCDRVLETAYRTGTKLYVGHNMRHMHVVRLMKQIIDRGEIGEVKAIWCRHFVGAGGDFYFKDWHADRSRAGSLLLQKGAHDIDVMHWLAGSPSREVTGMGELAVYGQLADRRDNSDRRMRDWYSTDNWPPLSQTDLNPVIDVEDISMILARLDSGVLISYEQCHFTPDYWRNYTVIGTEGRLENFGDGEGGEVRVWNERSGFLEKGHLQYPIVGDAAGHGDADALTVAEFVNFVRTGSPTDTSPLSARDAVAAGVAGTESIRSGSTPVQVPEVPPELRTYFQQHQRRSASSTPEL